MINNKNTPDLNPPKISVIMLTFNHDKFISRAIESILRQDVKFKYEIIISDDHSNDQTPFILHHYQMLFPDIVFPSFNESRLGAMKNGAKALKRARGEYVGLLDGDDYWTDSFKLKKQIEYLDNNLNCSLVSHDYDIHNLIEGTSKKSLLGGLFDGKCNNLEITNELFFISWVTQPLTVVFRRSSLNVDLILSRQKYFLDVTLFYYILKDGKGVIMNFNGGVYNVHSNGIWNSKSEFEKHLQIFRVVDDLMVKNKTDYDLRMIFIFKYFCLGQSLKSDKSFHNILRFIKASAIVLIRKVTISMPRSIPHHWVFPNERRVREDVSQE